MQDQTAGSPQVELAVQYVQGVFPSFGSMWEVFLKGLMAEGWRNIFFFAEDRLIFFEQTTEPPRNWDSRRLAGHILSCSECITQLKSFSLLSCNWHHVIDVAGAHWNKAPALHGKHKNHHLKAMKPKSLTEVSQVAWNPTSLWDLWTSRERWEIWKLAAQAISGISWRNLVFLITWAFL